MSVDGERKKKHGLLFLRTLEEILPGFLPEKQPTDCCSHDRLNRQTNDQIDVLHRRCQRQCVCLQPASVKRK